MSKLTLNEVFQINSQYNIDIWREIKNYMESNKDLSAFYAITDYECPAVRSLHDSIV